MCRISWLWEVSEEEVIIDYFRETNRNERQEVEMMKKCGDCIYSDNLMFVEEGKCLYYRAETGYNTGDNREEEE